MTRPQTLTDIPTPALIVDIAAMERNIERMAEFYRDRAAKLRPHFKAHKTPEIARRQLAAGSVTGLTCATVNEAEVAAEFCDDILIANQVIGDEKLDQVAEIAARGADIKVAIDSPEGIGQLSGAAVERGTEVGVVVDINVGMPRCGATPGEAVALARQATEANGIRLCGLMGYEGHAVGIPEREKREHVARKAMDGLLGAARSLRESGLPCEIVSAGGTGTYDITGVMEGITEVQAGSYVLMDVAYAKLDIPFEQAIWVLGMVISRPSAALCVLDSGHKACTEDHGNPEVVGIDGAEVLFLSDEHASVTIPAGCPVAVGDRVRLAPSHIDPTINLHDVIYALDGEQVAEIWPVAARGYAEQRRYE